MVDDFYWDTCLTNMWFVRHVYPSMYYKTNLSKQSLSLATCLCVDNYIKRTVKSSMLGNIVFRISPSRSFNVMSVERRVGVLVFIAIVLYNGTGRWSFL